MNEDMHTTFLNNNEQIIADLANLELEQERQIFNIIYDTFKAPSGLIELPDLQVLGRALGSSGEQVEDICNQEIDNFEGLIDYDSF
jgi:hypothetical protein